MKIINDDKWWILYLNEYFLSIQKIMQCIEIRKLNLNLKFKPKVYSWSILYNNKAYINQI